jgi:hypothetical protein
MQFGTTPIRPAALLGRLEDWVKQKAGQAGNFSSDCVFLSLAPDELLLKFPPADRFVTIFPARFPPWQGVVTGAGYSMYDNPGEEHLGFDAEIVITAFARYNPDQETRASSLVRDVATGLTGLFGALVGAVQFWDAPVQDAPTRSYLREPMRVSGPAVTLPRNYQQTFWTLLKIPLEMRFTAELG